MWCTGHEGKEELVRFSLETGHKAYRRVENDGDSLTLEETVASITTFRKIVPSCFRRNSWNCMNMGMSSKVLSGTMVRIIEQIQRDLMTEGNPPDLELECYAALASRMDAFVDIFNGNFGRSEYARKNGLHKMAGYVTSADDSKLEELMDILRFFEEWRASLEAKAKPGDDTWKAHFITDYSWTDIRVCILGSVSLCRYLFGEDSRFKVSPLSGVLHFVNPRNVGQDPVEHRFGHMRQGLGSHRNPTATQAKEGAARGDLNRGL
ncbi:unnamed protein product, partial [Ectocarpus sp. 12 AP-2014]